MPNILENFNSVTVPALPANLAADGGFITVATPHFGSSGNALAQTTTDGSTQTAVLTTPIDFSTQNTLTWRFYIDATGTMPDLIALFGRSNSAVAQTAARDCLGVTFLPSQNRMDICVYQSNGGVPIFVGSIYPEAYAPITLQKSEWYTATLTYSAAGASPANRLYTANLKRESTNTYLQHDGTWAATPQTDGAAKWVTGVDVEPTNTTGYMGVQTILSTGKAHVYFDDLSSLASGTQPAPTYTILSGAVGGDNYKLLVPPGLANTTAAPLAVLCHGSGADETIYITSDDWDILRVTLTNAGYRVVSGNFGGEAWGNNTAQNTMQATVTALCITYNTPDVVVYGASMGGLTATISAINSKIPKLRAVALNSPVLSLIAAHDLDGYAANSEAAYGGTSAYNAEKNIHDPLGLVLANTNVTYNLPFRFYVSSDDTSIPPAQHTTPFVTALVAPEKVVRTVTGAHVGTPTHDQTQIDDLVAFFARSIANYNIPATTFTLTAPTTASGGVGAVSGNFTITPNSVYTGTITPSADAGGGTFTPASLTWSGNAVAKTFTYTPASVGTKTITATASPTLAAPAGVTYTGNAATPLPHDPDGDDSTDTGLRLFKRVYTRTVTKAYVRVYQRKLPV